MNVPADAQVSFAEAASGGISVSKCSWRGGRGSYRRSASSYRGIDKNALVFVFVDNGRIASVPRGRYPTLGSGEFTMLSAMTGIFTAIEPDPGKLCAIMSVIVPALLLLPRLPQGAGLPGIQSSASGCGLVAKRMAECLCEAGEGAGEALLAGVRDTLVEALAQAMRRGEAPVAEQRMIDLRWRQLREQMERNFHQTSISARSVAAEMGISPRYLAMVLAHGGTSFPALLRDFRLTAAARLLLQPALKARTVSDVAAMVGIADPAYFSKLFKQRFGQTPGRYRQLRSAG
jgi:AraC-like DNA-binding protein